MLDFRPPCEKRPLGHPVQLSAKASSNVPKVPGGHSPRHTSLPVACRQFPSQLLHTMHVEPRMFSVRNSPVSHSVQAYCLGLSVNFPAAQREQFTAFESGCEYPVGQFSQTVAAEALEYWPGSHLVQFSRLILATPVLYLPGGHTLQFSRPVSSAYIPGPQS